MEFREDLAVTTINPGAVNTAFIDQTNNAEPASRTGRNLKRAWTPGSLPKPLHRPSNLLGAGCTAKSPFVPTADENRLPFQFNGLGWVERNLIRYAQWMVECGHEVEVNCVQGSPLAESASATTLNIRHIPRQHRHLPFATAREAEATPRAHPNRHCVDPRATDLPLCSRDHNSGADLVFHQGMQISQPKTKPWHRVRYKHVSRWIAPLHHLRDSAGKHTAPTGTSRGHPARTRGQLVPLQNPPRPGRCGASLQMPKSSASLDASIH